MASKKIELPEGPWDYDYHGDWSTYALGLEATIRVEFEDMREDDKIAISDLIRIAPLMRAELELGVATIEKVIESLSLNKIGPAIEELKRWQKASNDLIALAKEAAA